jgi:hypothetical protein
MPKLPNPTHKNTYKNVKHEQKTNHMKQILIMNKCQFIFNIMCTSWGPMFTSNQQIVVESQQGYTYGPMDMEVELLAWVVRKKAKLCKQTFIKQNVH